MSRAEGVQRAGEVKPVRVVATVTIDGSKETRIGGDSRFLGGEHGDRLEEKGLGFWLDKWQYYNPGGKGPRHKSRVFVPWSSVLYCEEIKQSRNIQQ